LKLNKIFNLNLVDEDAAKYNVMLIQALIQAFDLIDIIMTIW